MTVMHIDQSINNSEDATIPQKDIDEISNCVHTHDSWNSMSASVYCQ